MKGVSVGDGGQICAYHIWCIYCLTQRSCLPLAHTYLRGSGTRASSGVGESPLLVALNNRVVGDVGVPLLGLVGGGGDSELSIYVCLFMCV